ncbi:Amidase [Ancylostoma ceylanicum]|uniref:Amidase n=2 Tax=Ancylostoma ceylanicum TaxID=53326 RepID=A0A0D6MCP5_9BILA|nr:Amidase [Ancylostoma ceylanicum]
MLSHLAMHLYFLLISAIFWFVNLFKQRVSVPPPTDPLLFISATAAVQKIARKELTSSELIDAYIHRIKQINHLINAVVFDNFDAARKDAAEVDGMIVGKDEQELNELVRSKPLLGIPFTVKDAIEVEGMVITCGIYSQRHNVASRTAEAVMRLREAGGILLAITNVSEACLWTETSNGIYGRTKNPYDVRRSAGGSSGGEGALIGAAAGLIGVGCDVGGSIRIPAFMNGIFGMLTTPGVISIDGCIPPPKGYQCQMQRVGPMCRYAEDIALLVKAMASEETNCLNICSSFDHKKIRIFYMEGFRDMLVSPELSNDMKNALKRAVSHLEEKYDVDAVRIDLPLFMHAIDIISSCFSGHGRPSELMLSIHRDKGPVDWRSELPRLLMGRSVHSPGGVFTAMFEKKSCAAENESSTVSELSA